MDQQTLLYIMTAFVIISAIALIIQAGMLFGLYKTGKMLEEKVTLFLPKAESLVDSTQRIVEQSKKQILDIVTKANQIMESTQMQVAKVQEVVSDASTRAKLQMDRVEMVLDDTMGRAQETVALVHDGVMRPLREIQGISAGVRGAFAHLMRGGRPSVAQATHDEEMFI